MNWRDLGFFKNTLVEQILFIFILSIIVFMLYKLWEQHFGWWICKVCGRKIKGHIGAAGSVFYDSCDKCCGWKTLTHAQYNSEFGISEE